MQTMINRTKRLLCLSLSVLLLLLVYGHLTVPDAITRLENEEAPRSIYTLTRMTAQGDKPDGTQQIYDAEVSLFRAIPVKHARLTVSARVQAVPGGGVFGLRLYTSGVIVVSLETIESADGPVSPAAEAGLRKGDVLLALNGIALHDHNQFSALLTDAQGAPVELTVRRGDREIKTTFHAVFSETYGRYMAGLWVRDSAAGIGTMTFYLPQSGVYAGLGHAVCDLDTGDVLPLYEGDIVDAAVNGCRKGAPGTAGELRGSFTGTRIGSLLLNETDGVYGVLDHFDEAAATLPVALPREVHTGEAEIICTVDGAGPQTYRVLIEKVSEKDAEGRNLVLRVTDERLLSVTGGIVQGMSGSPVVQNGCLVGAVTHVFVSNPHQGYAIFAYTMARNCRLIEQSTLPLAS